MTLTPDACEWLLGRDAADWLARLAEDDAPLHQQVARLRKTLTAERVHLLLEQVELRRRGGRKFAHAERMFFTRLGLEQATDEVTASYKSQRCGPSAAVADLCCGIGGDLLALARGRTATGLDRNPAMALLATANARAVLGEDDKTTAAVGDVAHFDPATVDAWHIDPDRRPESSAGRRRRTTRVELHEPGPGAIDSLRAKNPHSAVKLAPAAVLPEHWTDEAELEWISRGRECRQLVAWFGGLAGAAGTRRATALGQGTSPPAAITGPADLPIPLADQMGRYVYEPDPAVLAAHLGGAIAQKHGLGGLAANIAYLTGDQQVCDPLLSAFEVIEVLSYRPRAIKSLLQQRGIGRLEVKQRGADLDPAEIQRTLQHNGEHSATLLLTRQDQNVIAILARRVDG
jgi:SAM-dependent methyltransferase